MSEQVVTGKSLQSNVARIVLVKLVLFSISLGLVPITSFFASQKYLWNGNATYAAITAVVSANLVLVAYIVSSVLEDKGSTSDAAQNTSLATKKQQ